MNMIPIGSAQIPYVQYDDKSSQIIVQYSTGKTEALSNVRQEDINVLLSSANRYDWVVRMKRRA